MNLEIKLVEKKDAEQIYDLFKRTWLDTYVSSEFQITKEDILSKWPIESREETIVKWQNFYEKVAEKPEDSNILIWTAKEGNKILGVITVDKIMPLKIGALYVLPEFQSRGIGKELIEFVFEKYKDAEIQLNVAIYNTRAINFYKKYGFKENGPVEDLNGKLPSGKVIPEINMIRPLKGI